MISITIVGAGVHGTRMADKYRKFPRAMLKAVVSRSKPTAPTWGGVPFFTLAKGWKKEFGTPSRHDVFELVVHQDILLSILKDFVAIGAKNFILPKPVAMTSAELTEIETLVSRNKLKVLVASQWHYSAFIPQIANFIKKNKKDIASVEVVFARLFEGDRAHTYTPANAFLPHALQILADLSLISKTSMPLTEDLSDTHIRLHYNEKHLVRITSDLREPKRQESLKIFLKGKKSPALVADFARTTTKSGMIVYPSFTIAGKKSEVKEDVLEKMIDSTLRYFTRGASPDNTLTLKAYEPVAKQLVRVNEHADKTVAVVGGGIFGILSALEIAQKGYPVVIFEKQPEILKGASFINQCRVHMGYHYPRDERTARESRGAAGDFEKMFSPAIRTIHNYYMMAKEGSLTSAQAYVAFCKKLNLPHKHEWPKGVAISKDKIEVSLKVPERIFDADKLRDLLKAKLAKAPSVALLTGAEVVGLKYTGKAFELQYKSGGMVNTSRFAAVVNAAYDHANTVNSLVGLPLSDYQYETIELLVMQTPWKGVGWFLGDGPFLGAIPFGFSDLHLMYDVDISVLERVVGPLPHLKYSAAYHNEPSRLKKRLAKYHKKWEAILPDIKKYKHAYSLYTTRMVLPKVEKTDARPTLTHELMPGMWQIFSGKITTSVPQAKDLAGKVDAFLRKRQG
jgi:hypothetical protein